MSSSKHHMIHALEFECQTPLMFYERCASCAQFNTDCPDLSLGLEILRGKKKIVYDNDIQSEESLLAQSFKCLTPFYYFENTRKNCGHRGRCREEGLLIALLSGKKKLIYAQKKAIEFPRLARRIEKEGALKKKVQRTAAS